MYQLSWNLVNWIFILFFSFFLVTKIQGPVKICLCWSSLSCISCIIMSQSECTGTKILQVPSGENLTYGDESFVKFEEAGIREARKAVFVLVAGGLGERLGYNGIKVKLSTSIFRCPVLLCSVCYILLFLFFILNFKINLLCISK